MDGKEKTQKAQRTTGRQRLEEKPKNPRPFNHTFEACGELSTSRTDLPDHKRKNKRRKMGHVVAEETESNGTASQCRSWTTRQPCCPALGQEPFRGNAPFDGAANVPDRGRQRPGEFPPKQGLKKGCCLACAGQVLLPVPAGSNPPPPRRMCQHEIWEEQQSFFGEVDGGTLSSGARATRADLAGGPGVAPGRGLPSFAVWFWTPGASGPGEGSGV